jgi:hypothetical protein
MATTSQELSTLAQATANWLSFHHLCGLQSMLNEFALTIPLATFLGVHSPYELKAEYPHPHFQNRKGRPPQIDFVLLNSKDQLSAAYECKWANASNEDIVRDLYRLESLCGVVKRGQVRRFFLIAGPIDTTTSLSDRAVNIGRRRTRLDDHLLSFARAKPERKFKVQEAPPRLRECVEKFQRQYYPAQHEEKIPTSIRTKLMADATTEHYRVLIWRVSRSPGTKCIRL